MTKSDEETANLEAVTDRALEWVLLLRSGRATTDDAEALKQWRSEDPRHEQAFVEAVRLYNDLGTLAQGLENSRAARRPHFGLSRRGFLAGGAVAASAAGYMVVHPPLGLWPSLVELSADYRTGKGEQRDVALSNDVSVRLNTQTSIAVRSGPDEAKIELISGEAAFVAHGLSSVPLVLVAAGGQVTAAQAKFNVRCIDESVLTTCIEGAVTVAQGDRVVQLQKGQQATYSAAEPLEGAVSADPVQASSWQDGFLVFRDKSLTAVVSEINRYRPGKIVVMNAKLGARIVNGTFRIDKLDDFVAQVRQLFDADVRSLPGGVVLLS